MDKKKTNAMLTAGLAVSMAAAGAAVYKNADYIQAERVRQLFKRGNEIRDKGLTAPDDVVRVSDLAYGTDPEQVLDIYYPVGTDKALPAIVSVHGGAYVYGDKNLYRFYCMSLAQRGFTVVNFSYRLAPKYRFPAQLEDTNAVMNYICDHAQENYIDLNNLFMVGDSAGAQLASQYCAAAANDSYAALLGLKIPSVKIRACALNCGLYSIDRKKDKLMQKCYFDRPEEAFSDKMDVVGNLTRDFPPSFIMTAVGDFMRDRAEPFAEELTKLGVENEVHVYGDEKNKLGHVFHCNMREPMAARCNDEECEFFRRHMK